MENHQKDETILKYFELLKRLNEILKYTNKISMFEFSKKNNVSKSLSTALQKGGVIKNSGGRAGSRNWVWNTIPPTREMAIRTIEDMSKLNPPRKKEMGGKREGSGRKTKIEEAATLKVKLYTIPLFWGLFNINIKPIYI